jgi:tetratricopeptide (TPR) repeat protein
MAACNRAIVLDRSDHRPLVWKGMLLLYSTGDVRCEEALMNLRRAYELNSNSTGALRGLGLGEAFLGNPRQAIDFLMRALRISPRDLFTYQTHNILAIACFGARDYEKSLHWASLAIRDAPNHPLAHLHFALACVGLGDIDKARAALDRTRRIAPEFVEARLRGYVPYRKPEDRRHFSVFLRIAAGLDEPGAADKLR